MNEIAKKCYYGKINETSDPLSISSIDTDTFDVYSYLPGKWYLRLVYSCTSPYFWYMYK